MSKNFTHDDIQTLVHELNKETADEVSVRDLTMFAKKILSAYRELRQSYAELKKERDDLNKVSIYNLEDVVKENVELKKENTKMQNERKELNEWRHNYYESMQQEVIKLRQEKDGLKKERDGLTKQMLAIHQNDNNLNCKQVDEIREQHQYIQDLKQLLHDSNQMCWNAYSERDVMVSLHEHADDSMWQMLTDENKELREELYQNRKQRDLVADLKRQLAKKG